MHIIDQTIVKCSKCNGTDVEYVTYMGNKFNRCRSCKHESEHKSIYPSEIAYAEFYKKFEKPKEITF